MGKKILVVGDTHFPWADSEVLAKIYLAVKIEKPDVVIQIGDLYDLFSYSKFPRSFNVITPQAELEEARIAAEAFWNNIIKKVPKASCYQLLGNHDIRPLKRVEEKMPEIADIVFKGWEDLYKFRGVNTLLSTRDDLVLEGVVYEHGYFGSPGRHCRENLKPTVIGHTHRGWVHYESLRGSLLWELNVGHCADPLAEPLSYPRKKWTKWTQGYGLIDSNGPRFCPV